MCGLSGFILGRPGPGAGELAARAAAMGETLRHRGPDDAGTWTDAAVGMGLAHRRLSILDLSPEGHQPMVSATGRHVLVYNGEIYNFADLKRELGDREQRWRGHSDTEVLLAALERWGVAGAVEKCVGMFAFALWDRRDRVLWLARDRLGIKPLYYSWLKGGLAFASEIRALRRAPGFSAELDPEAVGLFLGHSCIPGPRSVYRGVARLEPGHLLRAPLDPGGGCRPADATISCYWSVAGALERGIATPFAGGPRQAVEELDDLLRRAVNMRMVADVPLGAFLSGGTDSSTVVAMMQSQSSRPVRTFTIGSPEAGYDEARFARQVAERLGTEHHEFTVTAADAMAVIPELAEVFDEPFADSSQIPTLLVSRLARQEVTVVLSGDGGDELFAGYLRHLWAPRIWRLLRSLPAPARRALAGEGGRLLAPALVRLLGLLPGGRLAQPENKVARLLNLYRADSLEDLYRRFVCTWPEFGAASPWADFGPWPAGLDATTKLACADLRGYLPDDILVKIDRATMNTGLEARVPLLDHRVAEFALRLPVGCKVRGGSGKWLLRQVLGRYLPAELFDRPKMGFTVPLGDWLRGPLRAWAGDLLAERRLRNLDFLEPERILPIWHEHLAGRRDRRHELWNVLMLLAWHERHHG